MVGFKAFAAVAVVALMALLGADAHAGHFHVYPDTPTGRNYVRRQVGSCSINSWVSTNSTVKMNVTGPAMLWVYLNKNCTDTVSSAVELDIAVAINGSAARNVTLNGYATTGLCSASPPGGAIYTQNVTNGTDAANMIWFHDAATNATDGTLAGNAANSFFLRSKAGGALEPNGMRSFVIMDEDDNRLACCDFTLNDKPDVSVLTGAAGVRNCSATAYPPPSTSTTTPKANAAGAAAAAAPLAALAAALLAAALL